jgi:hypothetical protein
MQALATTGGGLDLVMEVSPFAALRATFILSTHGERHSGVHQEKTDAT